jgi:hypothetical protein
VPQGAALVVGQPACQWLAAAVYVPSTVGRLQVRFSLLLVCLKETSTVVGLLSVEVWASKLDEQQLELTTELLAFCPFEAQPPDGLHSLFLILAKSLSLLLLLLLQGLQLELEDALAVYPLLQGETHAQQLAC